MHAKSQTFTPVFFHGSTELFSVCESSGATDISDTLAVIDTDLGYTETWTIVRNPTIGTLVGFPITASSSANDTVTPAGLTYTPTTGLSGNDTFIVQVSNGVFSANDTLIVSVIPMPTLSSGDTIPPVCSGSVVSYTPTSSTAGATFTWSRTIVNNITPATASGIDTISDTVVNDTSYNIIVLYLYTITANGCSSTQSVFHTVKPIPALSSALTDTVCNAAAVNYIPTSSTVGTIFTWTRAAVAGISPTASSGAGTINETLNNSTSADVNTVYVLGLDAAGCTSVKDITVTVDAPVAGVPITTLPSSSLCDGTLFQNFGTSSAPATGTSYTWSAVNATIVAIGSGGQYSILSFNNPGSALVTLYSSIAGSHCLASTTYSVTVSTSANSTAGVIYSNYQFVYLDNTTGSYQWGYDDASTLSPTDVAGATFQSYPNASPDFINNYYWVITTKNGCTQKTYYNAPLAVNNVRQGTAGLKVYPTNASTSIIVEINNAHQGSATSVSLINMLGQTIKTKIVTGSMMQFDIADLPAGCYLVNCIENGTRIGTARFIKD